MMSSTYLVCIEDDQTMLQIKGYGLKLLKTSISIFSCHTQFNSSWDLCSFGMLHSAE